MKSSLNKQSGICLHLLDRFKGAYFTEHSVQMGAQISEQCILLNTSLVCSSDHLLSIKEQNQVCEI